LKDVYKTDVYAVCEWRNANDPFGVAKAPIPRRIITKPPSAELRPDQKDQDSLPPYEVLDAILHGLVEEEATLDEIVARGYAPELVERVQRLLYGSEYKRRQAPPGVKIGPRAFGRDRRYPIVNGYRDAVGKDGVGKTGAGGS
jgi:NAD+ synthase